MLALTIGDVPVRMSLPVQYRYEGNIFSGEKRMELKVVPALSVALDPGHRDRPDGLGPAAHEQRDGCRHHARDPGGGDEQCAGCGRGRRAARHAAGLDVTPASAHVRFERPDEAHTVRFTIAPTGPVTPGRSP